MGKQKAHRDDWGSVRQMPSGRWQARYTAPDRSKKTLGTFATKRDAREALARQRVAIAGGTWRDPDSGRITLADYVEGWIESRADIEESTRALHGRLLRTWIATDVKLPERGGRARTIDLGTRPVGTITAPDIRDWHRAVVVTSRRRAVDRYARAATSPRATNRAIRAWAAEQSLAVSPTGRIPAAVRATWEAAGGPSRLSVVAPPINAGETEASQAYRLLHAALTVAVADGLLLANPCKIKNAGVARAPERVPATVTQIAAIADAVPARYKAAVWVAAFSAVRFGELFALQRKHFDPVTKKIRVERAVQTTGAGRVFGPPKSVAGSRSVTIEEPALGHLLAHLEDFSPPGPDALIFGTAGGRPPHAGQVSQMLARAREVAGRPDLRWHDLRHTGATMAAQAGATTADLQARLGHASANAALRYQHTAQSRDEEVARRMAERIASEMALGATKWHVPTRGDAGHTAAS